MRRRKFIGLAGATAVMWPLAVRPQQPSLPIIGFLHGATANAYAPMTAAFRKSLNEAGYVEGQNVLSRRTDMPHKANATKGIHHTSPAATYNRNRGLSCS